MKQVDCKDDARILRLSVDEYGDYSDIIDEAEVKILFRFGMSENQSNFVANIATDAHAYISLNNPFVMRNLFRLEGMFLVFNRYGEDMWFKIEKSIIGRTLLTDNTDNCIHVFLSKSAALINSNESS